MRKQLHILLLLLSCTIFSCENKETEPTPKHFMSAKLNGMDWQASTAVGQLDYYHDASVFHTWIWTGSKAPLTDGVEYELSFSIHKGISKGKFFFNNNGQGEVLADGGVIGYIRVYKPSLLPSHSYPYFDAYSSSGFIEITHLTRHEIGGKFEFTAVPSEYSGYPASVNYNVESGEFLVPINLITGADWEGPK